MKFSQSSYEVQVCTLFLANKRNYTWYDPKPCNIVQEGFALRIFMILSEYVSSFFNFFIYMGHAFK